MRQSPPAGPLLYRYRPDDSPDGIPGDEGAFLLCGFWLADNLVGQGPLDEAEDLYASLCARASPLGLLSEQIDPSLGAWSKELVPLQEYTAGSDGPPCRPS